LTNKRRRSVDAYWPYIVGAIVLLALTTNDLREHFTVSDAVLATLATLTLAGVAFATRRTPPEVSESHEMSSGEVVYFLSIGLLALAYFVVKAFDDGTQRLLTSALGIGGAILLLVLTAKNRRQGPSENRSRRRARRS
jgi:hypothetical protein